jgi:hypothetical protein
MQPDETLALVSAQRELAGKISALDAPEPEERDLAAWLRDDRAIPAHERLRVYVNAYFARIHGVLRDDYGALHAALGDAAFHDLAKLYLMAHPPRSFSLRFAGRELPGFVAGSIGEPFRRRCPFAADLAALEWAITDVFDAPDAPVLERSKLAAVPPDRWQELRFELGSALRLLLLDWPVHRVREAWDSDLPLPPLDPASTRVLVYRRGDEVLHRGVSDAEARALQCMREGAELAAVCARVAEITSEEDAPARVHAMLERWLADGILCGLRC